MVLPEGAPDKERPRSRGRTATFVIAAAALVAGAITLGALTSPAPEAAAPETTTTTSIEAVEQPSIDPATFTVAEIARGEEFEWTQHATFDGYPIRLVEHNGSLYVFTTNGPYWEPQTRGVDVWRSTDGVVWDFTGQIDEPGITVYPVVASEHGLMAFGVDRSSGLSVWQSPDGSQWTQTPIHGSSETTETFYPNFAVANDDLVVVSGNVQIDLMLMTQQALEDATGETVDISSLGWRVDRTTEGTELTVQGPLGLPLLRIPLDELGLTEEQKRWMTDGGPPGDVTVWATTDGANWQEKVIEDAQWIESMFAMDNGSVMAYGREGQLSITAWKSFDGIFWEEAERSPYVNRVQRWKDRYVGAHDGGVRIYLSDESEHWDDIGLGELFPFQFGWNISTLDAGEGGIALVAEGARQSEGLHSEPEPVTFTRNHVSLTLDLAAGNLLLKVGETEASWRMHSNGPPEWIEMDLANERVLVADPTTGEQLVVFTFAELTEAEHDYWSACCEDESLERLRAFVFSPDGESWTIQDLKTGLGEDGWVAQLHVLENRVVALVREETLFAPQDSGFEVWSAEIP